MEICLKIDTPNNCINKGKLCIKDLRLRVSRLDLFEFNPEISRYSVIRIRRVKYVDRLS